MFRLPYSISQKSITQTAMLPPDLYRAKILPIADASPRPLWSVMIPTYHCAGYLRGTLQSVLAQAPSVEQMQIMVVDDGSTEDDPQAVVLELGQGRVEFYQHPQNVGYIQNFASCLQRSRGHLIHLLHGDDAVLPGFYAKMQQLFEQHPEIGAGFCRQVLMDDHGHWKYFSIVEQRHSGVLANWLARVSAELTLQTPAMVVRREVYETLGGFDARMQSCGEDWEMWCRIAAQYAVGYEPEPLVLYRDRAHSLTKRSVRTGQNIRDVRLATAMVQDYLPAAIAHQVIPRAQKSWADWAISFAEQMIDQGDREAARLQITEALHCSRAIGIWRQAAYLLLRIGKQGLLQKLSPLGRQKVKNSPA